MAEWVPGTREAMPDFADAVMASRYRLDDKIAEGGFGEVWRGKDVVLDRPVAIKLLRPTYATDPMTLARFRAEARHAASLSHANIAAVYDFCEPPPPGTPFLVMEYIAGPSLAALLADGPMSPAAAMDVIAGAAAGLAAAHRAGLVHRDIKPSNLLLSGDGRVKITDFGISHAAGSAPLTATGVLMGTPAYMAPERVGGAGGTPASDIYSLGIVAYHAVTGRIPFTGNPVEVAMAHRERPLPPVPAFVPPEVAAFIMRLVVKDPMARLADASEVAWRAGQLRDQLTAGPAVRPARRRGHARAPATPGRFYRRAGIASAAVAVTVLGLYVANMHTPGAPYAAEALPKISGPARSSAPHVAVAQTVQVNASSLIGKQVADATRELRALGLSVTVVWQPAASKTPGTVLSVWPAGRVPTGSRIELVAASRPVSGLRGDSAASSGRHAHRHGDKPKKAKSKDPQPSDSQGSPSDDGSPSATPSPSPTPSVSTSGSEGNQASGGGPAFGG